MSDSSDDNVREEDVPEGKVFPADDTEHTHVVPHDEDSVPPPAAPVGSLPTEDDDDDGDLPEDDDEVEDEDEDEDEDDDDTG